VRFFFDFAMPDSAPSRVIQRHEARLGAYGARLGAYGARFGAYGARFGGQGEDEGTRAVPSRARATSLEIARKYFLR
jgi:hypothetical protein